MESKSQVTYILTKFSERNDDRQVSSSVEVEQMKIERSDGEGTPWWIRKRFLVEGCCATQESEWEV